MDYNNIVNNNRLAYKEQIRQMFGQIRSMASVMKSNDSQIDEELFFRAQSVGFIESLKDVVVELFGVENAREILDLFGRYDLQERTNK